MKIARFLLWQPYKPLKYAAIACLLVLFVWMFWSEMAPPYFDHENFISYFSEYWRDILTRYLRFFAFLFVIGGAIHFIPVVMTLVIVPFAAITVVELLQRAAAIEAFDGFKVPDDIVFMTAIIAIMACLLVIAVFVQIVLQKRGTSPQ